MFLQKLKNFKNSVAMFWQLSHRSSKSHDLAASSRVNFGDLFGSERSSREGYSRNFRGSARYSLAGRPFSREKHLENVSQFCLWSVFAARPSDLLATHFSREKRVFCVFKDSFSEIFSFPSSFNDCSLSSLKYLS